jgi:hypothetical protein
MKVIVTTADLRVYGPYSDDAAADMQAYLEARDTSLFACLVFTAQESGDPERPYTIKESGGSRDATWGEWLDWLERFVKTLTPMPKERTPRRPRKRRPGA